MQIFPDQSSESENAGAAESAARRLLQGGSAFFLDRGGKSGKSGFGFDDVLSRLREYDPGSTPGIPAGFASVKDDNSLIKGSHLQELGKDLLAKGVDDGVVGDFMARVNSGLSFPGVGRMIGMASGGGRTADQLDEQESLMFNALLQKMGFSADEIVDMETMAAEGNGAALAQKLGGMTGGSFNLSREEAGVLARALELSPELAGALNSAFNGAEELALDAASFKNLMAPAEAHFNRLQAELSKLAGALPDSIRQMLDKAALEKNAQLTTGNRGSRKSQRSELLMRDGATSKKNEGDGPKSQSIAASLLDAQDAQAAHDAEENALAEENADRFRKGFTEQPKAGAKSGSKSGAQAGGESAVNAADHSANAKAAFAARVDAASGTFLFQTEQASSAQQQAAGQSAGGSAARYDARIFEQVQQGILRNAVDGSSNITMRLDPPELGKLTLSLTVLNGEIKALIRTDKAETANIVSEQVAQIKAGLEEQGFKVAGIEVETRPENTADNGAWNGAEQHNMEREAREKARLINLTRIRAEGGEDLARNLHSDTRTATIAEQGLHIIA